MHLKFHFHFSEIIQMSSVNTEPSQQWELFSILLWRGSWFWLFTHFGAIKSPRLRLGLFIAPKCVKSQNQLPFHTINFGVRGFSVKIAYWNLRSFRANTNRLTSPFRAFQKQVRQRTWPDVSALNSLHLAPTAMLISGWWLDQVSQPVFEAN